ncbi:MAG: HAMP domain-containing histidine kinase, partial [Oscillospiraceae bacterium]|nr:HAMP domain-containing histidine kinase [Oscillospiraceae bacterium]
MGKMNQKTLSLKWSFFIYLPVCFFIAFFGAMAIGIFTNHLQDWYKNLQADSVALSEIDRYEYQIRVDEYENMYMERVPNYKKIFTEKKQQYMYFIISNAQVILIPLWVVGCVALTGIIFYQRELKKPIGILLEASRKISENQLDFEIVYKKRNELGQLCTAFDDMRRALDENNRELWRSLEERKRLNSAFSHDLRTPLTVLKGYNDFLEKYAGQLAEHKISEILSKMSSQINRLENYTDKMSAVQKLEDIQPEVTAIQMDMLRELFSESGEYLCKNKKFILHFNSDKSNKHQIWIDRELVMEVYENILANAERYAENQIFADISVTEDFLKLEISDDGGGFSDKALLLAKEPFYRDDKEQNSSHFGLGLYICKIICEKCQGSLAIANTETGGKVTAL